MVHIKKLVLKGFKSFAKETEIPFSDSMNVIVGPNGSGKSNITDAICFVLGRMSIKSIRAAKAANLIFAGTKQYKPSAEGMVKMVLDNSDKKIAFDTNEITIARLVRSRGQSTYKINDEIKTRQEVLELLAQAGIDPYGFNIVLQGEIDSIVRMSSEERRKIIEEVAGISIYEVRKEKSLKELEKTEERLKEVQTTLRERTAYLRNLEEERKQALKFKKLENEVKEYKASIIKRKLVEKEKELSKLNEERAKKENDRKKLKEKEQQVVNNVEASEQEISRLNQQMQKSSGIEQEQLNQEISDLRAELAGLEVEEKNKNDRIEEIQARKNKAEEEIKKLKQEIEKLRKEFPSQAKKQEELEKKKEELGNKEKEKKRFYNLSEKLNTIKELLKDKEKNLQKNKDEVQFLINETDKTAKNLSYKEKQSCLEHLEKSGGELNSGIKKLEDLENKSQEYEKLVSVLFSKISNFEEIKTQVDKLDICPLCKSKITPDHIKHVFSECDEKIKELNQELKQKQDFIENSEKDIISLKSGIKTLQENKSKAEIDIIKIENIEEKKERIKTLSHEKEKLESEISAMKKEKIELDYKLTEFKDVEQICDRVLLEIQEISERTEENIDTELEFKERTLANARLLIKQSLREEEELNRELEEIKAEISEKEKFLGKKEQEEETLEKKYHKLIEKRTSIEKQIHESNTFLFQERNRLSNIENETNNLKIEIARISAEKSGLDTDFLIYKDIQTTNLPVFVLEERLYKTQAILQTIGSVNLRALEVYDKIKEEYDAIAEKVSVLEKEKEEILKIIEEIDKKKIKTFMKTLNAVNDLFNRNFMQLSVKGQVFLEPENQEDIFAAGLDIVVKVAKGKYFDVTSLSGGEQTLVALSLIFAIQEYKPYCFYIFDEVDAALDKRNSERLASLIKRYMKTGQYIIVTHNDSIISESTQLYGVSMQEGVSKLLSLEI